MSDIFSSLDDLEISDSLCDFSVTGQESALCVPQDSMEEIEFFPNFMDDPISLTEALSPVKTEKRTRVAFQDCDGNFWLANNGQNVNYKQRRSKREGSKRAWRMNEMSFGRENEEPRRKCSHCETTETPQWRMGPMGPKTLCNACGVRYKSGRLLPEYRPAASPTFDSEKFSNFHRKIMKKKGMDRFC